MDHPDHATRHGRAKKRTNALAAILCGTLPALWVGFHAPFSWPHWLIGLAVGLIWGNGFEYAYHRFLLHRPRRAHSSAHQAHHANIGTPDQAEYVALITSPLNIVLLFVINGIPAYVISAVFGLQAVLSGVFIGWTTYLIVCEELHWRIHMGGWIPPCLQFARAYHMSHHDIPNSRYNVFFPLFDFLLGTVTIPKRKMPVASDKPESAPS